MKIIVDGVGKLSYKNERWEMKGKIKCGKHKLKVAFEAFEDDDISKEQIKMYKFAMKNLEYYLNLAYKHLMKNYGKKSSRKAKFNTVYFNDYSEWGFLGDWKEDPLNGVGAKFYLKKGDVYIQVGTQEVLTYTTYEEVYKDEGAQEYYVTDYSMDDQFVNMRVNEITYFD